MDKFRILLFALIIASLPNCNTTKEIAGRDLYEGQKIDFKQALQTITFGSCNREDEPQTLWTDIIAESPDLWIWLGDNIYGDTENMGVMKRKYMQQKGAEEYRSLRNACPVVGIWDDHDYGVNDGDKTYPLKAESKNLMLDFLDVPANAEVRKREGAYQAYTFGPTGQQVKVILLDARYFRDKLEKNDGKGQRYIANDSGDILGAAQWEWLEEELTNSRAAIHLIASGIQILPEEHYFEKWANFPKARKRLFAVLQKTKPAQTILLSGDRHLAEISKITLQSLPYPLYEITSSGMTHSYEAADEPNQHRVGPLIGQKNYGILKIDWTAETPVVRGFLVGPDRKLYHEQVLE